MEWWRHPQQIGSLFLDEWMYSMDIAKRHVGHSSLRF